MIMIPGLQKGLYGFQSEGVIFIDARKGNSIIADQMGTGKTVQALAYLQLHPELRPAVVVVPASVKLNWAREAEKWMTDPAVKVLSGKTPYKLNPSNPYIYIINYDILRNETEMKPKIDKKTGLTVINPATGKPKMEKVEIRNTGWGDFLSKISPRIMIVDECQFIKNKKALQTKAVLRVGKTAGRVIGLSGTPIVNRPVEFYNIIDLVKPNLIGSFWDYARTYCGATHNGFGWDFGGATNMKKLHQILSSTIMIRRKKSEVLKDLPAKTRTVVPLEIDNRADYQKAANDIIGWIEDNVGEDAAAKAKHAEILVQFEKLKQLAVKGKMKMAIQWIKDFIDTGEKLVVFATHKIVIDELMKKFGNIAVKIDGSTLVKKRLAIIDQFQEDPNTKLFVGNMKAAGAGITLTAAFNAVILELGWTPGEHDQAEDRIHRIGQENAANIWYLIADDTIENEIATLLDDKRKVLTAILDGEDVKDESILTKLIESVRGDKQ